MIACNLGNLSRLALPLGVELVVPRRRTKEILVKDDPALNKHPKRLWIGMGTQERDPSPGAIGAFCAILNHTNWPRTRC